jgi:hypothetical protein
MEDNSVSSVQESPSKETTELKEANKGISMEIVKLSENSEIQPVPLDLHQSPDNSLKAKDSIEQNDSLNKSTDSKKSAASDSSDKKRRKRKPIVTKKVPTDIIESMEVLSSLTDTELNIPSLLNINKVVKSPNESDAETIDKIAAMVSNITQELPAPQQPLQAPLIEQKEPKIEDELEKMFAEPPTTSEKSEVQPSTSTTAVKPPRKRKANPDKKPAKKRKVTENGKKSKKAEPEKIEEKKPKDKKERQKVKSDVAPFVQIAKDGSFAIVNQVLNGDEEGEKASSKPKKFNKAEKRIRGLHVSTLSNKYDADKRDLSWICVFCKLGPHKNKMGDLFGPYVVSKKSEEFNYANQDPSLDPFNQTNKDKFQAKLKTPEKPKKKKKSVPSTPTNGISAELDIFNGMSRVDDDNYEIWFHEDCIVWSNGVHMIGSKLIGMDAAVWSSTRYQCSYCQRNGAMMKCLTRGCTNFGHFGCAQNKNWRLTDEFKTFCENH